MLCNVTRIWRIVWLAALFAGGSLAVWGQISNPYRGNLRELRDKSGAALLVAKLGIVSVTEPERAVVEKVLQTDRRPNSRAFRIAYAALAPPLEKFAKSNNRFTGVRRLDEAEVVVFFNFVEFRRILDTFYPYGELYLVRKTRDGNKISGRILWQTDKIMHAEDAAKKLVKALRDLDKK